MPGEAPGLTEDRDFARVLHVASSLPEVLESRSYGTPALKLRGRLLARLREANVLAVHCPLELKEVLIDSEPDKYFETPHYQGWPMILMRLDAVDDIDLLERLTCAWLHKAPKRLADTFVAAQKAV